MGYIRVALAAAVLFGHFVPAGWHILPNDAAVQGFFMVSGFYMFLILDTKYTSARIFYLNRALRIYPSYFFVLAAAVIASLTLGATAHYLTIAELAARLAKLEWPYVVFLIFTNLTMIAQDVVMFLHIDGSALAWTNAFYSKPFPAYHMLIVPQAWSLGVEIWFYLLAPFLVRLRSPVIIAIITVSFCARVYVYFWDIPWYVDPWNSRFFLFEIALFLTGGMMYRATPFAKLASPIVGKLLLVTLVAFVIGYDLIPMWRYWMFVYKYDVFLVLLAISLPFLHTSIRYERGTVNKFLGELSYPIYINHLLIFNLLGALRSSWPDSHVFFAIGVGSSIALAILMVRFIEEPIDRYRQAIARGTSKSHLIPGDFPDGYSKKGVGL